MCSEVGWRTPCLWTTMFSRGPALQGWYTSRALVAGVLPQVPTPAILRAPYTSHKEGTGRPPVQEGKGLEPGAERGPHQGGYCLGRKSAPALQVFNDLPLRPDPGPPFHCPPHLMRTMTGPVAQRRKLRLSRMTPQPQGTEGRAQADFLSWVDLGPESPQGAAAPQAMKVKEPTCGDTSFPCGRLPCAIRRPERPKAA